MQFMERPIEETSTLVAEAWYGKDNSKARGLNKRDLGLQRT
jgi:hypothetical protein